MNCWVFQSKEYFFFPLPWFVKILKSLSWFIFCFHNTVKIKLYGNIVSVATQTKGCKNNFRKKGIETFSWRRRWLFLLQNQIFDRNHHRRQALFYERKSIRKLFRWHNNGIVWNRDDEILKKIVIHAFFSVKEKKGKSETSKKKRFFLEKMVLEALLLLFYHRSFFFLPFGFAYVTRIAKGTIFLFFKLNASFF